MRQRHADIRLENLTITGLGIDGHGTALFEKGLLHIAGALPGDKVDIHASSKAGKDYFGKIILMRESSPLRIEPYCRHFGVCGGCQWQHIAYPDQLKLKKDWTLTLFDDVIREDKPRLVDILGCDQTTHYRNKVEYTFSNRPWTQEVLEDKSVYRIERNVVGFHVPGRFDKILDVEECFHQPEPANAIRDFVMDLSRKNGFDHFNNRDMKGFMRNLVIRNTVAGEFMVIVSFGRDEKEWIEKVMSGLRDHFPQIQSLYYVINPKSNSTLFDLDHVLYAGRPEITERIGGLNYRIGPKSFFQTNSLQAERLYEIVKRMAGLTGAEILYDLYTGAGTIACYLAGGCKKVIGIEFVPEAIVDARKNAERNGITNAVFFSGDAKTVLNNSFLALHGHPDVVVLDPPRPGLHEDVVATLLHATPDRIVYVSCNPESQARDIGLLRRAYAVVEVEPIDMLPQTKHVENVVLLKRRG